jgi:transposase
MKVSRRELADAERNQIIGMHLAFERIRALLAGYGDDASCKEVRKAIILGTTKQSIANTLNHPKGTVHTIIRRYKLHGTTAVSKRIGRPPKLSKRNLDVAEKLMMSETNRRKPIDALRAEFIALAGIEICKRTFVTNLWKLGWFSRIAAHKPLVSETNRKKRVAFAQEMLARFNDDPEIFQKWLFSDEKRFCMFMNDGRIRVLRKRSKAERYRIENLVPSVKLGNEGVMMAACCSHKGIGPIVREVGKVNATLHTQMLGNAVIPELKRLGNGDLSKVYLQEDNAPVHTAKITQSFKAEQQVQSIKWPAQSPDLNPIENLWDECSRRIRQRPDKPKNLDDLEKIVKEEWQRVPIRVCEKLIDSMPKRLQAVIDANGGPTRY